MLRKLLCFMGFHKFPTRTPDGKPDYMPVCPYCGLSEDQHYRFGFD